MSAASVQHKFEEIIARIKKDPPKFEVLVGYDIYYAVFVHWNLVAHHPNGQALFLLEPYRKMLPTIKSKIAAHIVAGKSLKDAIVAVAEELKEESQKLVPVLTGALKASAYVKVM